MTTAERVPPAPVAGLSRLGAVPPPPARRPRPTGAATAAPTAPPAQPPSTATRTKPSGALKKAPDTGPLRTTTLSLPVSLIQQLRDRARGERISQVDVLLDAISATHDRLHQLIDKDTPRPVETGLFLRTPARRTDNPPRSTITLRILDANVATIDDLVEAHGAPSRSALCAAALTDYLSA